MPWFNHGSKQVLNFSPTFSHLHNRASPQHRGPFERKKSRLQQCGLSPRPVCFCVCFWQKLGSAQIYFNLGRDDLKKALLVCARVGSSWVWTSITTQHAVLSVLINSNNNFRRPISDIRGIRFCCADIWMTGEIAAAATCARLPRSPFFDDQ